MNLFPFLIGKVLTLKGSQTFYESIKAAFPFLIGKVLTSKFDSAPGNRNW